MRLPFILTGLLALAAPAGAITLDLPGNAVETARAAEALGSLAVPVGPWRDGGFDSISREGGVTLTAWRIGGRATTLQLLAPLREQLRTAGYQILFECETDACGGFDFRYDLRVLPEPDMHVDLGDFRFLSARNGSGNDRDNGDDAIFLLVSRASESAFVQIAHVGPTSATALRTTTSGKTLLTEMPPPPVVGGLVAQLEQTGAATLDDLDFASGSAELSNGDFTSLTTLAEYLRRNPARQVTIVGHTDTVGALAGNIALSKRRATSVMERLIRDHGVSPDQIAADGVGYLAPRASNLDSDGRSRNRRVEVILTSTD